MQLLKEYNDLLLKYGIKDLIPYFELIETIEWFEKRRIIIERDKSKCTMCGNEETAWIRNPDGSYKYYWLELKFVDNCKTLIFHYTEKKTWIHIHHKFYIKDLLPWEYKDEDLITYCNWCHLDFHRNNKVKYYERINNKLVELSYTPCYRCSGAGWFPEYRKIQNGICFRCHGARYEELILKIH